MNTHVDHTNRIFSLAKRVLSQKEIPEDLAAEKLVEFLIDHDICGIELEEFLLELAEAVDC